MSIATAIQNAQQKVTNAYTAVNQKGGTLPATQNLSNLPAAINSISTGTTPTGTLSITTNGVYDVTNYASANVSVSGGGSNTVDLVYSSYYTTRSGPVAQREPAIMCLCLGDVQSYSNEEEKIIDMTYEVKITPSYLTYIRNTSWHISSNTDYTLFYVVTAGVTGDIIDVQRIDVININENTCLTGKYFTDYTGSGGSND